MNGMFTTSNQEGISCRALILDNNSYFLYAVNKWSEKNSTSILSTNNPDDFFYHLAVNDDIDIIFVSYNPVWTKTLHLLDKLQRFYPDIRTVVVVDYPHIPSIILMRSFGVNVIITKKEILSCLQKTVTIDPFSLYSNIYAAGKMECENIQSKYTYNHKCNTLTEMERMVLAELSGDKTISLIARERGCSAKTVNQHKQNALNKMGFKRLKDVLSIKSQKTWNRRHCNP